MPSCYNQGRIGFLNLPAELRNMIYAYNVEEIPPVKLSFKSFTMGPEVFNSKLKLKFNLLLANKQVSREFASMLYRHQHFIFYPGFHDMVPDKFFNTVGLDNLEFIQNVSVQEVGRKFCPQRLLYSSFSRSPATSCFDTARLFWTIQNCCPSLKTFTLDLTSWYIRYSDSSRSPEVVEYLKLITAGLKGFLSLPKIIIKTGPGLEQFRDVFMSRLSAIGCNNCQFIHQGGNV